MIAPLEDVAVTYLSDWNAATWVVAVIGALAAAGYLWIPSLIVGIASDVRDRFLAPAVIVVAFVLALAAVIALVILPGTMMRHLPDQGNNWWVWVPGVLIAIAFGIRGLLTDITPVRAVFWVAAGAVGIGTILGLIADTLNRVAAAVPTTVGVVVVAIVAVFAVLILGNRERN